MSGCNHYKCCCGCAKLQNFPLVDGAGYPVDDLTTGEAQYNSGEGWSGTTYRLQGAGSGGQWGGTSYFDTKENPLLTFQGTGGEITSWRIGYSFRYDLVWSYDYGRHYLSIWNGTATLTIRIDIQADFPHDHFYVTFFDTSEGTLSSTTYANSTWFDVDVQCDGTTTKVYINSTLAASNTNATNVKALRTCKVQFASSDSNEYMAMRDLFVWPECGLIT